MNYHSIYSADDSLSSVRINHEEIKSFLNFSIFNYFYEFLKWYGEAYCQNYSAFELDSLALKMIENNYRSEVGRNLLTQFPSSRYRFSKHEST